MNSSSHLTDDQFATCALGEPDAACTAHLVSCAACREEVAAFAVAMRGFSAGAMRWSEAQPRVSLRAAQAERVRTTVHSGWRWAVATALVVGIGVPVALQGDRVAKDGSAVVAGAASDTDAQIAQDNQLMQSVTLALGAPEPSPLDEYGLSGRQAGRAEGASQVQTQ